MPELAPPQAEAGLLMTQAKKSSPGPGLQRRCEMAGWMD
jgi:hypothetical protein